MIYIIGDTHGKISISTIFNIYKKSNNSLSKKDYVIILGDFGFLWKNIPDQNELVNIDYLNNLPFTILFVCGNHENFTRINECEEVSMFGSKVHKVSNSIFHLKRGHIYNIEGKTFFVMGGANSIDKDSRIEFLSWWKEEIPSYTEQALGLDNLKALNNTVDYILTHTCPNEVSDRYLAERGFSFNDMDPTRRYLSEIYFKVKFKKWFFGHWHEDWLYKDFVMVWEGIHKI